MTITPELRAEVESKFGLILREYERVDRVAFVVRHTNAQQTTFTWTCVIYFSFNSNIVSTIETIEQITDASLLPSIGSVDTLIADTMDHFIDNERLHYDILP
jgi:hypothetical protein